MKLIRLWIEDFKNLQDVTVDFDNDPERLLSVVIGWNGTGKSNFIEALVIIFRDLDLGENPSFTFKLKYECRGRLISVDGDPNRKNQQLKFSYQEIIRKKDTIAGHGQPKSVPFSKFKDGEGSEFLPKNVFGYYSGPSNRLAKHFEKHQHKFYQQLINPEKYGIDSMSLPLRPLFYARLIHSQFVLLPFFLDEDPLVKRFLEEQLGIVDLDSILFVMHNPSWKAQQGGDKRFWRAKGIVQKFLSRLYDISIAPHRVSKGRKDELLYLFVRDRKALRELSHDLTNADFFKELESTYISDLIEEVRIRVVIKDKGALTFRELSEGEQQLITVLGLLRFTAENESLFLLDEPDTHLNPAWGMKYIEFLESIAGLDGKPRSQVVLATHDPIVLASLYKEQVQVMKRDEENLKVSAEMPQDHPIGMGYTGILTSEMFGMRSDLDQLTLSRLDERAKLASVEDPTTEQKERLEELSAELDKAGFMQAYSDPYFSAFVSAWARRKQTDRFKKTFYSDRDREDLAKMTDEILEELDAEDQKKR